MKEILPEPDRHLSVSRPDYYTKLEAPLSNEAIATLETQYSILLPEEVKTLYRWKNGQHLSCSLSFINNSTFMALEEVLSSAKELNELIPDFDGENWWRRGWLPIFHNGGGDRICYDTEGTFTGEPGQLIEFWHADSDRNVIAASLSSFLQCLLQYYETTPAKNFNDYFSVKEETGFPKTFTA